MAAALTARARASTNVLHTISDTVVQRSAGYSLYEVRAHTTKI